jgi:hypothetical protein
VNGKSVQVTTNLASALRHIRDTGVREVLDSFWVDAICIDQDNVKERNHQVRFMGSLYRKATLVISWLGPEAANSTIALSLIHRLAQAFQKAEDENDRSLDWFKEFPELWNAYGGTSGSNDFFKALISLALRPFHHRGWIFQESCLAQRQICLCGWQALARDDFVHFHSFSLKLKDDYSKPDFIAEASWYVLKNPGWISLFGSLRHAGMFRVEQGDVGFSLIRLLRLTWDLKVSNPQDKVYSLLGIIEDQRINMDYERPVADLYCQVAQIWLQDYRTLDFLALAGIKDTEKTDFDLPSWAPNWYGISRSAKSPSFGAKNYCASAHVRAEARLSINTRILRILAMPLKFGKISTPVVLESMPVMFSAFKDYALRDFRYPNGEHKLKALFRTFLAMSRHEGGRPGEEMKEYLLSGLGTAFFKELCTAGGESLFDGLHSLGFSADVKYGISFRKLFVGIDCSIGAPSWSTVDDTDPVTHRAAAAALTMGGVYLLGRRFFYTENGHLGISNCDIGPTDVIHLIPGCSELIVLRKVDSHHVVVGACWIYGLMDGELMEEDPKFEILELR